MIKKTTQQYAEDLAKKFNIFINDFELLTEYDGWDKQITFKCLRCGLTKTVIASSLLKKDKKKQNICRCYGYSEEWLETNKKFNQWKESQNNYTLLEDYKGVRVNIFVKCNKCGAKQRRSIQSLINNQPCLVCENKANIRKTHDQFLFELNELYGEEYIPQEEYINATTPILMKHSLCGKVYYCKPHNILTNKGGHCPICSIISKGEQKISLYLKKNKIQFETQKRLDTIKKMPFDFYLPSEKLLIEYQGIQHFQPVNKFGGQPTFLRQIEIDKKKKEEATKLGYNFLVIKYTDYNNIENLLAQRLSVRSSESEKITSSQEDEDIV